ncbi:hypothetical protein ACFL59_08520, partial [Planctomycetota bacterium]
KKPAENKDKPGDDQKKSGQQKDKGQSPREDASKKDAGQQRPRPRDGRDGAPRDPKGGRPQHTGQEPSRRPDSSRQTPPPKHLSKPAPAGADATKAGAALTADPAVVQAKLLKGKRLKAVTRQDLSEPEGRDGRPPKEGSTEVEIRTVVADTRDVVPKTRDLRSKAQRIAGLAAARAERMLSQVGYKGAPVVIKNVDVDFELTPNDSEEEAVHKLSARIVRQVVGRWKAQT